MGAEHTLPDQAVTTRDELVKSVIMAPKSPLGEGSPHAHKFSEYMNTSAKILDVLCSYRMDSAAKESRADEGCLKHLAIIYSHVKVCSPRSFSSAASQANMLMKKRPTSQSKCASRPSLSNLQTHNPKSWADSQTKEKNSP